MDSKVKLVTPAKNRSERVRCVKRTGSHGSFPFEASNGQCARVALYRVNGKAYCRQHAGDALLSEALLLLEKSK